MSQRYHIINMTQPCKSKTRSSVLRQKLMQQVVCYAVLRLNLFSIFWLLDKAISTSKCKLQYSVTKFFLLFFDVVYKAPWKCPKSNVCPQCCTSSCCALCNYLDGLKKERENNCETHCATADDFMLTPVPGFHPRVKCL